MKIAVIHNRVGAADTPDAVDVLQQAEAVASALADLGHEVLRRSCTLDLEAARRELAADGPDLVFNLVEDLAGFGRLIHLFPFLLDALRIPYTGSPAESIFFTSHKILAKERMRQAGLPTPAWTGPWPGGAVLSPAAGQGKWIIKSLWEHASVGLDENSVLATNSPEVLREEMQRRCPGLGGACFAEQFIDGREFNLSLLAGPAGPEVLPPAEILFAGFSPDMVRIVDYRAKWDEDSYHYRHTQRTFDFGPEDEPLLRELTEIARRSWHAFGLAGYARVDFRVDEAGRPYILEINANPCLSPDAGFAAALERAGLSFAAAVARIVADSLRLSRETSERRPGPPRPAGAASYRQEVAEGDAARVGELVASTGFFHGEEVAVAVELVEERLAKGDASGYHFLLAEQDGRLVGYSCFGPIPCTQSSFDLYWIAVRPDCQGQGLGRRLLEESERRIREAGGTRVYVDTSQREQYASTRAFYERCGYRLESLLVDFYAPGDGKAVYGKQIGGN